MSSLLGIKRCAKCKENVPTDGFYKSKTDLSGLNSWCIECSNKAAMTKIRANLKRAYERLGEKCKDCGITSENNAFFDMHHRVPSDKDFNVPTRAGRKFENLIEEIDKCDLLCPNCHRTRHITGNLDGKKEES